MMDEDLSQLGRASEGGADEEITGSLSGAEIGGALNQVDLHPTF